MAPKNLIPTLLMTMALAASAAVLAQGQIFRCVENGVTIFADHPCDESAEPHVPSGNLSVSGIDPEQVQRIKEENRLHLERRQELLAEQRREQQRLQAQRPVTQIVHQPRPVITPFGFTGDTRTDRPRRDQQQTEPTDPEQRRFSALGGRQPGARRRPEP